MFWSQKGGRGVNILLRFTENMGGPRNPFPPIGINAFRTTNFESCSAMRGAKFHGNTRHDSITRILSILGQCMIDIDTNEVIWIINENIIFFGYGIA